MSDRSLKQRHEPTITKAAGGYYSHCSCGWACLTGSWTAERATWHWAQHLSQEEKS